MTALLEYIDLNEYLLLKKFVRLKKFNELYSNIHNICFTLSMYIYTYILRGRIKGKMSAIYWPYSTERCAQCYITI